jgi:hypothetical protein
MQLLGNNALLELLKTMILEKSLCFCSTVVDAHRLSNYSVDVSGDYVIFKTVHYLNLIESPYDLNYLNKTKLIRRH